MEQQLISAQSQDENTLKLIRLQRFKISQAQTRIAKVQEGFEGGVYSLDDAKRRIANHQETIARAEKEIQQQEQAMKGSTLGSTDIEAMRDELKSLRDRNLDEATFDEKLEIVTRLGIKVYPSVDLKSMRVVCRLNLEPRQSADRGGGIDSREIQSDGESECGKVMFGSPSRIRTLRGFL